MTDGRSRRALRQLTWVASSLVLPLCAVAALALGYVLLKDVLTIRREYRYDTTWEATQAVAASQRFQLALADLVMRPPAARPDEARLRFEVLESTARSLRDGQASQLLPMDDAATQTLRQIDAAVRDVAALMPRLDDAGEPSRILAILRPLNRPLASLAARAKTVEADAVSQLQHRIEIERWRLGLLLAVLIGYALVMVGSLHRRNRLLVRANVKGGALAADLRRNSHELEAAHAAVQAANAELTVRHEHFNAALEHMTQGLCMVDASGRLIVCNRRFEQMFKLSTAETAPGTLVASLAGPMECGLREPAHMARTSPDRASPDWTSPDRTSPARGAPTRRLSDQSSPDRASPDRMSHTGAAAPADAGATFTHRLTDGRTFAVSQEPLPTGGWVATFEDVTERRRVESHIAHMAHHDALTGLPNRLLYGQRMSEILSAPKPGEQPVTVLLLDLDHFKEINDTLGHGAGDALLKEVAERLRACTRETDLVARLGGDEFAIILCPAVSARDAAALADRIVRSVGEPYQIEGERLLIGVSLGIAMQPTHGASAETLLKFADMALYQAKADGRRTWCFYEPAMDAKVQERRAMTADLREAITLGQFDVHYQPLIDLASDRVAGFEALLRWRHPQLGMVPPSQFVPLLEEHGLIGIIGEWVLRKACAEAVRWPAPARVAVNLSPRQFRGSDIPRCVEAVLADTGLAPGRLELEITESLLLQDGDDVLNALRVLRALGIGVALDDFGTGYSSLSYLRKFPFSKLKIDQYFVRGIEQREDCVIIIQAVASMAYRLGMTVTAEGIETEAQLAIVREAGCTQGQGYFFGHPASAAEAFRLITSRGLRQDELDLTGGVAPSRAAAATTHAAPPGAPSFRRRADADRTLAEP